MKYALQLYSIRDHIKTGDDMLEMLGKVKEAGYQGVEFAGFFGLSGETLRARLDELGLVCVGAHCGLDDFDEDKLAQTLRTARALGTPNIGIGGASTGNEKDLQKVLDIMGKAQKIADGSGIKVYFHNHTGEFAPTKGDTSGGKTIFERIMEACYIQVDTYWSFHAGIDTPVYLEQHKDRIATVHLKDGIDGTPKALGEGQNDVRAIIKKCDELGIEWGIVENDDPEPCGIEDVTRSIRWLLA